MASQGLVQAALSSTSLTGWGAGPSTAAEHWGPHPSLALPLHSVA
jgi:hypothetical protein